MLLQESISLSEVIIAIHKLTDKLFPGDSDFEGKQVFTCILSLHNYKCQFDMNLVKFFDNSTCFFDSQHPGKSSYNTLVRSDSDHAERKDDQQLYQVLFAFNASIENN